MMILNTKNQVRNLDKSLSAKVKFNNSLEINKEGLSKGITQPKIIVEGVVTQIDAILNTDIDNNPYLQVFLNADESIISIEEKNKLIEDAKFLIINEINPAYQRLNSFLKNE